MSKISTYEVAPVPKLADKLIGTSVGGEIEDVTYNFTLQELLDVFLPVIPANNLQGVLDYGNTATQDINLFGTITTTNLEVTDTANLFITYLNEETHIVGSVFDSEDSAGTSGQVLTSTGDGVEWVTLPPIFTPNLQQVLEEGNTADLDIVLDANIQAFDISSDTANIGTQLTIQGTVVDYNESGGTAGQVLSSTSTNVEWINLPVYTATSPLFLNPATGVFSIQVANNTQNGYLSSSDWINFNGKQNAGNYITALTGEATASGPGSASVTLSNSAVIGKVLTGFNPTAGTINPSDSILTAFGKTQSQINALVGGVQYQGVWNASTNTPTLTSSVGVQGHYYVVNVAGNTNLNGITDWQIGDWAIFSESVWQKVDNTDSVTSVNGFTGAVSLTTDNIPEGSTNLYFLNSRARLALSSTSPLLYNNTTGVFSIQQANSSQNGFLSNTDWTTFNSKQDYLGGTGLVKSTAGTITYITDNSGNWNTAYNDSIVSAAVTGTGTKTLTLNQQDAGTITASWTDLGLTSVGLSMPLAFNVANNPLTNNGTIAVTAAGVASQYIRGDGTLANFPTNGGGGGGSVSYYLNGSVNQGTFGGNTYYEMSKTPIIGAGTDFSISADGYIAQFITDAGDPALLNIPAGNWNFEMYFSASSGGGTPSFYVELYKYDGVVFTLISSSSTTPESITGGTAIDLYTTAVAVPSTVLTLTDRLAIRVYVTHSGRTITLHTEDNHLCQVITTFSTGITALNGLTAQVQYFQTGASGTDFNISSLTANHTFNLPVASATNTGKLSSTDWSTFNDKQPFITAGTTLQYFRGDKTFQTLNTTVVPEGTNLYYLDSRARAAVSANAPLSYNSSTGVFSISQSGAATDGFLSSTDWNTFNNKQASGNYITSLTGEATGTGPGATAVTLNNASVTAKVLTGINITGGTVQATDTMLTAFGKLQNQINGLIGSTIYQGTWNASTNTPALTSGVGVRGYYYIVSVAGTTNLDGITDWFVGDWAIFDGTAWQQVDNTDSVTSVNGFTGAVSLTTDNISEGVTNLYFTNARSRSAISLTTTGSSGVATYNNTTGVFNIPNYGSALSGYLPLTGGTLTGNLNGTFIFAKDQFTTTKNSVSGSTAFYGFQNLAGVNRWNFAITGAETGSNAGFNFNIDRYADNGALLGTSLSINRATNTVTIVGILSTAIIQSNAIEANNNGTDDIGSAVGNKFRNIYASSFVKTGGTSSQYLMADGSVSTLTNPITGSGTNNFIPKFTTTGSTIGNSVIQESSSLIGINVTPTRVLHLSSSGTNAAIRLDNTVSGRPFLLLYDDSQNLTFINSSDSGYTAFNSGTGTSTTKMLLSNSGNLMIGSSNAGNAGTINVSVGLAGTTSGGIQLWAATNQTHYLQFGDGTTGASPYVGYVGYVHSTDSLIFGTATTTKLTIANTGVATFLSDLYVGRNIYVTDVEAGVYADYFGPYSTGSTPLTFIYNSAGSIYWSNGGIKMALSSGGNLGIGNLNPTARLSISSSFGASNTNTYILLSNPNDGGGGRIRATNLFGDLAAIEFSDEGGGDDGNLRFFTASNASLSERLRITSLGVTQLRPASGQVGLEIFNNTTSTGALAVDNDNFIIGGQTAKGLVLCTNNLGQEKMRITVDGNYQLTNTVFGTSTDVITTTYRQLYPSTYNIAQIAVRTDGQFYTGAFSFRTADASNANVLVERMRISSGGVVRINGFTTNALVGTDASGNLGIVNPTYTEVAVSTYSKPSGAPNMNNGSQVAANLRNYNYNDLVWGTAGATTGENQGAGVSMDFGSSRAIRRISLYGYNVTDIDTWRVDYSDDNSNWTALQSFPNIFGAPLVFDFNATGSRSHRYWRIIISGWTARSTTNWYVFKCVPYI